MRLARGILVDSNFGSGIEVATAKVDSLDLTEEVSLAVDLDCTL